MVSVVVDSLALVVSAAAMVCWPSAPGRGRLAALGPGRGGRSARMGWLTADWRLETLAFVTSMVAGAMLANVGGAIAAGMVSLLGAHSWRAARRERRRNAELAALVDAVGLMVAELRAGAHPVAAASAASTGEASVHRVLASAAAGARLGARVPVLLTRHAASEPAIADGLGRLASAWELAEQHGVALADLVEAVRTDLDTRLRLAGELRAQLAGPRATAIVLAMLPVLGVALGESVGAGPWRVLSETLTGQVLLAVGTTLACAGTAWSGRIMARAVAT
jgi:tight adherence protein B